MIEVSPSTRAMGGGNGFQNQLFEHGREILPGNAEVVGQSAGRDGDKSKPAPGFETGHEVPAESGGVAMTATVGQLSDAQVKDWMRRREMLNCPGGAVVSIATCRAIQKKVKAMARALRGAGWTGMTKAKKRCSAQTASYCLTCQHLNMSETSKNKLRKQLHQTAAWTGGMEDYL